MMTKKNLYLHYGARRSGNHGFVYWLREQIGQDSKWINNLHIQDPLIVMDNDKIESTKDYSDSKKNYGTANFGSIIYSIENQIPHMQFINTLKMHYNVFVTIIIRDPRNHLASIIRTYSSEPKELDQTLTLAKRLTEFAINHQTEGMIIFNFEDWMQNKTTRLSILKRMGINTCNDQSLLQRRGWGCSVFTKDTIVDIADMLDRHKYLQKDEEQSLGQEYLRNFERLFNTEGPRLDQQAKNQTAPPITIPKPKTVCQKPKTVCQKPKMVCQSDHKR